MNRYLELLSQHWRITVLRILAVAPGYRANDSVLHAAMEGYGHILTRDQVKTTLAWLAENALVAIEPMEDMVIATILQRGQDVAEGRALVPGVKRPGPR